ncbi:hypothetical protein AVEN_88374-1 [Araneus ventricosus]|uniref:Uncharacterized protein n=1 Tax=Araneus ventricosus TaxID=182803 RepID=A0A4Y2IDV1_ARAVE|nr:hypothetical protein AVEN_88374-1 [Araneus ventricosus]
MQGPPSNKKNHQSGSPEKAMLKQQQIRKERKKKAEEKDAETKANKVMDLTGLTDSLHVLREVKIILLQEFPTLLEAARRCRQAKTKQEKALIVLSALKGD